MALKAYVRVTLKAYSRMALKALGDTEGC